MTRSAMLEVLARIRAYGAGEGLWKGVVVKHALRNALLPL